MSGGRRLVGATREDGRTAGAPDPRGLISFAGLPLGRPLVMGVINVTPDSFSDGGETLECDAAVARGRAMMGEGADILDVGGESTRPGAGSVSAETEIARITPVVRELSASGALISIDTRHAAVMAAALVHGARIVNDITALAGDPGALEVVAASGASAILMHMQGEPGTMQIAPHYDDAPSDVFAFLRARLAACARAGLAPDRLAVDPGIGFGKTLQHNLAILARLDIYGQLGCALVVGVSRKSFIGRLSGGAPPRDRLAGSLAAGLAAVQGGAHILRVHDVAATRQALAVWQGIADLRKQL